MSNGRIDVERRDMTTIRLDLRSTNGRTTVGQLRDWLARCETAGADDGTPAFIVAIQGLLGESLQPMLAASVDHHTPPTTDGGEQRGD